MYQIATLGDYYEPDLQGQRQPRFEEDNSGNPIEYDTIDEAKAVIKDWLETRTVLGHNQYGVTYLVVESAHGDYILGGRNSDMSNYDWDNATCDCGECDTCFNLMIDQDRQYLLDSAVYKS